MIIFLKELQVYSYINQIVNILQYFLGCIITDAGIPYQVTVVAFTSVGRGIESYPEIFFTSELSPIRGPENVKYERFGMTITVSWDPIPLIEVRGFPTYTVTLIPLSPVSNASSDDGIISVITNDTSIVNEELDPDVEYTLIVTVTTDAGEASTDES